MDDHQQPGSFESRSRPRDPDPGRSATIVAGLVVIAVGMWFFLDRTLGIDLPPISWSSLWPLAIIGVGAWILLGAANRRR